jgi:serine/threonine protein kinase
LAERLPQDQKLDNHNETEAFELINVLKTWAQEKRTPASYGSNGLVFKMANSEAPESLRKPSGLKDNETDTAIKTLKIFKQEVAKKEYDMLLRASEIIAQNQREDEKIALVPRPINKINLDIDEDIKTYLNSNGSRLDNNVGVISMDFIEGTDLATILYRNFMVLRGYPTQDINSLDFGDLHTMVSQELGLLQSKETAQYSKDNPMERNMIEVRKFLKKSGFVLDASILERVQNTIDLFRKNNLYHNDLHERNIMITPDNIVFLIDFGHASIGPIEKEDGEDKLLDDYGITRRIAPLTKSVEADLKDEEKEAYAKLNELKNELPKTIAWQANFKKLQNIIKKNPEAGLQNYFISINSQDAKIMDFMIMLVLIYENERDKNEEIISFVANQITDTKNRPFLVKQFKILRDYLNIGL